MTDRDASTVFELHLRIAEENRFAMLGSEWFSAEVFAKRANVSLKTINTWADELGIKPKQPGGMRFYRIQDWDTALAKAEDEATS